MNLIKKYWKYIAGFIGLVFGIIAVSKAKKNSVLDSTDEKIKDNNSNIDKLKGASEVVEAEKKVIKKDIKKTKQQIKDLKSKPVKVTSRDSVKDSKKNILKNL